MSSAHILGMHERIEEAFSQLALARALKEEAETLKDTASTVLMEYMEITKKTTLTSDITPGTVKYVSPTVSKKFNKDKAKQSLLNCGVDADLIAKSFDTATEQVHRAGYVSYRLPE